MKEILKTSFIKEYNKEPEKFFSCGGRFEVLGNHTDHNHGCCIAATADLCIFAAVSKREDSKVNLCSEGFNKFSIELSDLEVKENEITSSQAIVRGIANYFKNNGNAIGGFDAYIISEIPAGSGVSSSAAFELLISKIFNALFNNDSIDNLTMCKASQYAERKYYGKACGLLDQIGVCYGGYSFIDFGNIDSPIIECISYDLVGYQFVIVNSGGSHAGLDDLYKQIPQDMYDVAHFFNNDYLRDVEECVSSYREEIIASLSERAFNRAMHFYNENKRSKEGKISDSEHLIQLMNESRESSTTLLKNMCIENKKEGSPLEACELILKASNNKAGVKINGGGFAGTVIALVPLGELDNVITACEKKYGQKNVIKINVREDGPKEI